MISGYPKDIILSSGPLGGAGDGLLYSTLPERFSAEGHNIYVHPEIIARNDEVLELLYGMNPFFQRDEHGALIQSNYTPNAGYCKQGAFYDQVNKLPEGSAIEAMERVHGLPPPYSKAPRIYYKPKPYVHDLSNVILMDMSSLSSAIHEAGWAMFHQKMTDRFGPISLITLPPTIAPQIPQPEGVPSYEADSIFTYIDMLASCRAWIGSEAGGQALAAAVRGEHDVFEYDARPEIVCLMAPNTRNSGSYCFRGVNYRTSKLAAGEDYLQPVEVAAYRYEEQCRINTLGRLEQWRRGKGLA